MRIYFVFAFNSLTRHLSNVFFFCFFLFNNLIQHFFPLILPVILRTFFIKAFEYNEEKLCERLFLCLHFDL